MVRVAVLVLGPAGCGKTTFCSALIGHLAERKRNAAYFNLDPAAESCIAEPAIDIRTLISVRDAMEELGYGPNGGLIYCLEFLLDNLEWLETEIGDDLDDYIIIDCPGQIELYSHVPILPRLTQHLKLHFDFRMCAVYLLESAFMIDKSKFLAGVLSAMSAMIMLELPHINVISKMDLVKDRMDEDQLQEFLEPDATLLQDQVNQSTNVRYHDLNSALVRLIDDFSMVNFLPLSAGDEDSVERILSFIDDATQWAEDQEPREPPGEDENFKVGEQ